MRYVYIAIAVVIVLAGLWYFFGWGRGDGPPTEDTSSLEPAWVVTSSVG